MVAKNFLSKLTVICCTLILVISCQDKQKDVPKKKNAPSIVNDHVTQKKKFSSAENPIYEGAERLNMLVFGRNLKHQDFTTNSKKIPDCASIFDFKELINVRGFLEPTYNRSQVSDNLENYAYFIFEYPTEETAKKILQLYATEATIMHSVPSNEIELETLSERQKKIYYNSKFGGIIFNSNHTIIYLKESCSTTNTSVSMQWSTYKKIVLNSLGHQQKDTIVSSACNDYSWEASMRK